MTDVTDLPNLAASCAEPLEDYRRIAALCGDASGESFLAVVLDAATRTLAVHLAGAAAQFGLLPDWVYEDLFERSMNYVSNRQQDRIAPVLALLEGKLPVRIRDAQVADMLLANLREEMAEETAAVILGPARRWPKLTVEPTPPTREDIARVLAVTGPRGAEGWSSGWGSVLAAAHERALDFSGT